MKVFYSKVGQLGQATTYTTFSKPDVLLADRNPEKDGASAHRMRLRSFCFKLNCLSMILVGLISAVTTAISSRENPQTRSSSSSGKKKRKK